MKDVKEAALELLGALGSRFEELAGDRGWGEGHELASDSGEVAEMEDGRWEFNVYCGYIAASRMDFLPREHDDRIQDNAAHEWMCCFSDFAETWNEENPDFRIEGEIASWDDANRLRNGICARMDDAGELDRFQERIDAFEKAWYIESGYDFLWNLSCWPRENGAVFRIAFNMVGEAFPPEADRSLWEFPMGAKELADLSAKAEEDPQAWDKAACEICDRLQALAANDREKARERPGRAPRP